MLLFFILAFLCLPRDESHISQLSKEYEESHPGVLRSSGDVSSPTLIHRVDPPLPESIPPGTRISGRTLVIFVVDENGKVQDPVILRSQYSDFDRPLLAALKKWRYRPAMKNGRPVSVFQIITFNLLV